jgi:hypothetical protein
MKAANASYTTQPDFDRIETLEDLPGATAHI